CNCLQLAESFVFHRRLLLIEVPSPQKLSRADALTRAGKAALPDNGLRNDENSALLRRCAKRYLTPNQTEDVQNVQFATRLRQPLN
ncbi:hypothetical protein, partial [Mesorhizobium sp. M7A.F.Ca.CA.001.09.2.1]|uniref:hypothetical protein n=1 Tax=Mesorhizobium sp. M7A.F.Ca.CA.001.09.2.1 TaxID=2496719 RepID=UPI0019D04A4E